MSQQRADLRWGVKRRLEFIEFRLFWDGHINRNDLIEHFGISTNQATADFTKYARFAPGNMYLDRSAQAYVRGAEYKPVFLKPDASLYLAQLRSVADGIMDQSEAWLSRTPDYDAAPTPVRGVNAITLRSVASAINHGEAMEVKYQSLSRPEPSWRWIAPHAIGFDGFRWHVRAHCFTDAVFKDFLISRILDIRTTRQSEVEPQSDEDWHTFVTLEIAPHPELSKAQQKVIALDYAMKAGKTEIRVRRALLYYALRRLGLDTDPAARRPEDQQIVLTETTKLRTQLSGGIQGSVKCSG